MLTGIALILIAVYVIMPKAIATTLIVFGAINIFCSVCRITIKETK